VSQEFQFDVFLSHSTKDNAVVRTLAERLRQDGLKVWFDEWVIKLGDSIPAKIEEGLEHSRVLVLCMSANAFGSDWAQLEAGTFRFRDPLNKERRFIPLRLDDAPIKGSLAQFLYINWLPANREQEYAKLLEACRPQEATVLGADAKMLLYGVGAAGAEFSGDGRLIVIASTRGPKIAIWEGESMQLPRAFQGHTGLVNSVALSGNKQLVLSGSNDQTVRVWSVENGRCLGVFEGHTAEVRTVGFNVDASLALSGSEGFCSFSRIIATILSQSGGAI